MNPLASAIEELLPARVSSSTWCYVLLRTALVLSTVCVAVLIPFFGKMESGKERNGMVHSIAVCVV